MNDSPSEIDKEEGKHVLQEAMQLIDSYNLSIDAEIAIASTLLLRGCNKTIKPKLVLQGIFNMLVEQGFKDRPKDSNQ